MPDSRDFLGELRLGRQLTSYNQVALGGGVIILGLVFLLTDSVLGQVGARAPLASFLTAVVIGMSLASILELLGGSSERGGLYILVHDTLGGSVAFLTGLSVLVGSLALAAALSLTASFQLARFLSLSPASARWIALGIILFLILLQLLQIVPRRFGSGPLVALIGAIILIDLLSALPSLRLARYSSLNALDISTLGRSVGWLSVTYMAFEALLSSRSQIRAPGETLPRAIGRLSIATAVIFVLGLFLVSGLEVSPDKGNNLVAVLSAVGGLPGWLISSAAAAALILAANGCLLTAARQIHSLSLVGSLPKALRRVWAPLPLPVLLFFFMALIAAPLTFWAPVEWSVFLAAGLFLAALIAVDAAAIYSQRTEPERRRKFEVPFAPLVPALAIATKLVLLNFLPFQALIAGGACLLLGGLYYLVYGRFQEVEALEGEVVFGRVHYTRKDRKAAYRILVPIGESQERHLILRMAIALARQRNGEVIPLQIIVMPDPLAIEEGQRMARERNTLFQWSTRTADALNVPVYPITRLARSVPEGIIDTATEEECDLVLMSWPIKSTAQEARFSTVLRMVTLGVAANVAVVAYRPLSVTDDTPEEKGENGKAAAEPASFQPERLLVPTAGGPHAPLAIELAVLLAREYEAEVDAIYIVGEHASQEEIAQGEERVQQTIAAMRELAAGLPGTNGHKPGQGAAALREPTHPLDEFKINPRVVRAPSVVSGIAETGGEYDLVLMGASEESVIDQVLFGNVPEQVARECDSPVLIVKRYRGLPRLWLRRAWDTIFETLPTLEMEDQMEVFRTIHRGARPDIDFFIMIGLSAIIAVFGLMMNSIAVIIGAMLVAPLFSPLLALGLSIVQGNARLLRLAVESTLKGIFLSIGLAFLLTVLVPLEPVTREILIRSSPTLFDLGVALAAGAAGAYAIARKDVAAALPGVAIAAALIPPLGVVGIGLARGDLALAGGSSLLLATNLVAIALASSLIFLLLGFRPSSGQRSGSSQLRRGLVTTITLFVLVSIPLGVFFAQSVGRSTTRETIRTTVTAELESVPGIELVDAQEIAFENQPESIQVTIPVYASGPVDQSLATTLGDALSQELGKPVIVRLIAYPLIEGQSQ